MLRKAEGEEQIGPHDHIFSQFSANQVRSQSFPRSRSQVYAAYLRLDTQHIEEEWIHQNHPKAPVTSLTNKWLASLETVDNKIQKDMRLLACLKSHVKSSSSESLLSQQPEECCEDLDNLSPDESSSDFEDYVETMINYQSNPADFHPQTLSDAKHLSLKIGRNGIFNYKFNSLPGKFTHAA